MKEVCFVLQYSMENMDADLLADEIESVEENEIADIEEFIRDHQGSVGLLRTFVEVAESFKKMEAKFNKLKMPMKGIERMGARDVIALARSIASEISDETMKKIDQMIADNRLVVGGLVSDEYIDDETKRAMEIFSEFDFLPEACGPKYFEELDVINMPGDGDSKEGLDKADAPILIHEVAHAMTSVNLCSLFCESPATMMEVISAKFMEARGHGEMTTMHSYLKNIAQNGEDAAALLYLFDVYAEKGMITEEDVKTFYDKTDGAGIETVIEDVGYFIGMTSGIVLADDVKNKGELKNVLEIFNNGDMTSDQKMQKLNLEPKRISTTIERVLGEKISEQEKGQVAKKQADRNNERPI